MTDYGTPFVPPAYRRDEDPATRGDLQRLDARLAGHRDEPAAQLVGLASRIATVGDAVALTDERSAARSHKTNTELSDLHRKVDELTLNLGTAISDLAKVRAELRSIAVSFPCRWWRRIARYLRLRRGPLGCHAPGNAEPTSSIPSAPGLRPGAPTSGVLPARRMAPTRPHG